MKKPELDPDEVVRQCDGLKYFGYKSTQLAEKIKAGEIPAPFALSPGGRAKGWLGRQIIEHHQRLIEASQLTPAPQPTRGKRRTLKA